MVANHAPVLVGIVAPDGQHVVDALVVVGQHGLDHVIVALGLDQVEEGVQGSICIPEGKDGVISETLRLVNILVQATIFAVYIFVENRPQAWCDTWRCRKW